MYRKVVCLSDKLYSWLLKKPSRRTKLTATQADVIARGLFKRLRRVWPPRSKEAKNVADWGINNLKGELPHVGGLLYSLLMLIAEAEGRLRDAVDYARTAREHANIVQAKQELYQANRILEEVEGFLKRNPKVQIL